LADAEGEAVDGRDLTAFGFKTLPTREFLVHEQAIEENLYTSFTLFYSHFQRHNRLSALAEALAAKRLPLHTPTQDAVDLPKMVQVVCRFQADELLDRLPSAYLVDPIALHPPCARDRLQQSQVALAQRPKDPCRKARILLRVTQALRPYGLIPPR
jgi:hypothetical protein